SAPTSPPVTRSSPRARLLSRRRPSRDDARHLHASVGGEALPDPRAYLQAMENESPRRLSGLGWVMLATSLGFVVVQLDVTIANVALPRIAAALATGVAGLQWVVDAYTLTFAVLLLSAGVLGDRFGARRTYVTGFLGFALASLGCGLAPS